MQFLILRLKTLVKMKCVGVHATRSDEEQKLSKKIERNKTTSYIIVFWFFFRGNSFYFIFYTCIHFFRRNERGENALPATRLTFFYDRFFLSWSIKGPKAPLVVMFTVQLSVV